MRRKALLASMVVAVIATTIGGAGVVPSNRAGRTLADLITGAATDLTRLPWVNHRSPRWEPEPIRWLGITTLMARLRLHDTMERMRG